MSSIREKLKTLPDESGVYIMLDEYGNVLYVGKSKKLKDRVRQYFHGSVKNEKTMALVSKIVDFNYIITNSEYDALILENNLIKRHNPPYNILLKDDKTYPYIKIRMKDKYPRIEVTRKLRRDGSRYFGPYMLGVSVKDIMELIHSVFPIRYCNVMGKRECLNFHIGRCLAPCTGRITEEEYAKVVTDVIQFLEGNNQTVEQKLQERMAASAEREEFELAKYYRDNLAILDKLTRKQTIPFLKESNLDVFSFVTNGAYSVINCFAVRGGKFLGGNNFPYNDTDGGNALASFIMQYYEKNPILVNEIIVNCEMEFKNELHDFLSHKAGRRIAVTEPSGGIRKQIVELGEKNAAEYLERQLEVFNRHNELTLGAVEQLQKYLSLSVPPVRMECYDISHISGTNKVASMVVFKNGEKATKHYRHFKIKTVAGNNDFACMYEVLKRRLENLDGNDPSFSEKPDLIIVDGGKGQLAYALKAKEDTGQNVSFISLAKREEEVFLPGCAESVMLPRSSLALKLIIRIRDEAHRFAITHHRNLRQKVMTETELSKIPGIGKIKAKNLIMKWKRMDVIESSTVEQLMETQSIGKKDAENILEYFRGKKK